ncbi:hypothetical protein [Roseibium suaedae]|uniref:Uncharacterized protein n=1 Tax=Roseibium suaedae TaxID=735517 RepID=A0A1M7P9W4_9HYPH|nr:hypothetical protein [Roseibium suaedae]SHN13242.1 hypothetical protein SAMN05444272_4226 [Roseibium suaedae]
MSLETSTDTQDLQTDEIGGMLLAQVGNAYWLLEGEEHLDALLNGRDPYPTPVKCLRFSTASHLQSMMPEGQNTGQLWGVHPAIVERVKRRGELMVFTAPELG